MALFTGDNADNNIVGGLTFDFIFGRGGKDRLEGRDGNDTLNGGSGGDTLLGGAGSDYLDGGSGDDALNGGIGQDYLLGGAGSDRFDYNAANESPVGGANRDVLFDFSGNGAGFGDRIDLHDIDANPFLGGDQAFQWIQGNAFDAPGQVRYSGGVVQVNISGNGGAEMEIQLIEAPALTVNLGANSDILL